MDKEFIPYNEALALKELGFNERCLKSYGTDKLLNQNDHEMYLSAPLWQQAFRWFREIYGIRVSIEPEHPQTYEEAELACLRRLISIVKTK